MFRAFNSLISRLDSDPNSQSSGGHGGLGFQVLRNKNPDLAFEPWFDFICEINGRQIHDPDPSLFAQEVRNCAGSVVTLGIWSAKGQRFRQLRIPVPAGSASLGITLQWTPFSTTEDVWHILDVAPNSPADEAGLLPYGDYIIGTPEGVVRGEAGLGELVEDHLDRPLRLYVYNHEYNATRSLTINPTRHWGGEGALGCVLGFGALHRLPAPLQEPPQAPGETLFESARLSHDSNPPSLQPQTTTATANTNNDFLIPATLHFSPTAPSNPAHIPRGSSNRSPGIQAKHKQRVHHNLGSNSAMEDYFREGEQKSREVDYVPETKAGREISPPPKAGGGPPPPPRARTVSPEKKE
ncbi:MAG: hypothetical protein M1839_000932 [Geoglossum umbratile]|nr:MAG: hypothetical protein M1839_000932 [Geoglossum umbratile]